MAEPVQDDHLIIAQYPLGDTLNHLRDALQKAEQVHQSETTSVATENISRKAILRLLNTLQGHEAASELLLRTVQSNVASELAILFVRIQRNDFKYDRFRSLTETIIRRASDFDIWQAVRDLITSFSHITPPESIKPSSESTPFTYSSASQQGSEQTRALLHSLLFHELGSCTYRNVEGFFPKYFENTKWCCEARDIYASFEDRRGYAQWPEYPDPPEESAVWEWLSQFQTEFLANARGVYCTTSTTANLTGAEAKRQLDFFIKRKTGTINMIHEWKDVLVIGEHRLSNYDWKGKFLQLSTYVRDIFSIQPTRRFVHAFTLLGTMMELWVFDRSGAYSSGPFDIHEEPKKFIQAIAGYALMNDDELGLDNFIQNGDDGPFITVMEDASGQEIKIQLEEQPMVINRVIVCRGTTCFRSKDRKQVIKMSWPSEFRPPEAKLLRLARDSGVEGVASLVGSHDLTSIRDMRSGLKFPPPHQFRTSASTPVSFSGSQSQAGLARSFGSFQGLSLTYGVLGERKSVDHGARASKRARFNSQQSKLREEYSGDAADQKIFNSDDIDGAYKNRVLSCLVISPAGRTIRNFKSIKELLTALCDAIKAHRSMLTKAKILHRDISENNIIITSPEACDGRTGMLIDLDLAIVDGERTGARHQTGTLPFMAIDVLLNNKLGHTYRHDLESFFYVLLWISARRAWEIEFLCKLKHRPKYSALDQWYGHSMERIAEAKRGFMHADGFKSILKEFPPALDGIKPLCRQLRKILFPFTLDGELDLSTPEDPQVLYGPIINAFEASAASQLGVSND